MKTIKTRVYLDMDGTIADLYNQPNWLGALRSELTGLFLRLQPMITEERLYELFPKERYEIVILSMTPKGASKEYCERVKREKDAWLSMYFPSLTKRIYKQYGNNKNLKGSAKAILIDDNKTIRDTWKGIALNPAQIW